MRSLVTLALFFGLTSAAPVPKALKKADDRQLILGRWMPAGGGTQWYQFNGDGTLSTWYTVGNAPDPQYKVTLDPTASPKRITWIGLKSGKVEWEGLYELDGDNLKVAYSPAPKVPTGFEPGQAQTVIQQTRDTSAK
jgi:uncharacterized protein (TIGR03067 family)